MLKGYAMNVRELLVMVDRAGWKEEGNRQRLFLLTIEIQTRPTIYVRADRHGGLGRNLFWHPMVLWIPTVQCRREYTFLTVMGKFSHGVDSLLPLFFNSFVRQHEPICLENTRVDVLREIKTSAVSLYGVRWLDGMLRS